MDEDGFWRLVDDSRARSGGDPARQAEALVAALAALEPDEIRDFAERYGEQQDACFGRRFWEVARELIGFVSDDGFEDFQAWLIARGRKAFAEAVADPRSLLVLKQRTGAALDASFAFEEFAYAPMKAYGMRTGKEWWEEDEEG